MKEAGGGGVIQRRKIKWAICKFSISRILLNQSLREKKKMTSSILFFLLDNEVT